MQLTIGPILFEWDRREVLRFYDEMADMPVDRVYIGEVVCAKKMGLGIKDIENIGKRLEKEGKEVVVSSLAVVSNEEELNLVRKIAELPFPVEANDMSVFNLLRDRVSRTASNWIIAGPHITAYNVPSIEFLKGLDVRRVVFPVELSRDSIRYNIKHTGIEGEVFGHGRVPLAFSWRCYTSRAYNLGKTNCQRHCRLYPDGLTLRTSDGFPLFAINGTSILSAKIYTLIESLDDLRDIGVSAVRISPQLKGMSEVVDVFRRGIDGMIGGKEGLNILKKGSPYGFCNGWYMGKAGKDYMEKVAECR